MNYSKKLKKVITAWEAEVGFEDDSGQREPEVTFRNSHARARGSRGFAENSRMQAEFLAAERLNAEGSVSESVD